MSKPFFYSLSKPLSNLVSTFDMHNQNCFVTDSTLVIAMAIQIPPPLPHNPNSIGFSYSPL